VRDAFKAGGDGYILKWDASEELVVGMRQVCSERGLRVGA